MALSKDTIKKLNHVLAYIKKEPRRLDMKSWGYQVSTKDTLHQNALRGHIEWAKQSKDPLPPCGTVGCFAGNTLWLLAPKEELANYTDKELINGQLEKILRLPGVTEERAVALLGLTQEQGEFLFYPFTPADYQSFQNYWPPYYRQLYAAAAEQKTPATRAKARVAALELLVKDFIACDGDIEAVKQLARKKAKKARAKNAQ